ncbi:MAG TPA: 30S ribosomal protein S20 [Candidatus Saccharimonadales bacterium]|nr:30S ribosomal protein S20 [Candidatus Saccharimonadales bacterium]
MPIIKSARKRVRTANKATSRNNLTRRDLRSALKLFSRKPTSNSLISSQSKLDKAANKGVIHKNKAARLKARSARKAKASGIKPVKAASKKPATATKKSPTKPKTASKTVKKTTKK